MLLLLSKGEILRLLARSGPNCTCGKIDIKLVSTLRDIALRAQPEPL